MPRPAAGRGIYLSRALTNSTTSTGRRMTAIFAASKAAIFSADDPAVYPVEAPVTRIDVRPAVREEVALAASTFPLCREDCAGLCPRCGTDLNTGPCGCAAPSR